MCTGAYALLAASASLCSTTACFWIVYFFCCLIAIFLISLSLCLVSYFLLSAGLILSSLSCSAFFLICACAAADFSLASLRDSDSRRA